MKILVLNGPNLNMLGIREPEIYGDKTYAELKKYIKAICKETGVSCDIFQSNSEGKIVTEIQKAYKKYDGIIINAAAYTHYSIAILDALSAVKIPSVEVHLSDIESREDFRKESVIRSACIGVSSGKGFESYKEALQMLIEAQKNV